RLRPGLGGVRGIVLADAQHGLRAGDRGADPLRLRPLPDGKLTGGERLAHPRDTAAGEEIAVDLLGEAAEAIRHPLGDDSRFFLAHRAQTSQFHGHSVHDRARVPSPPTGTRAPSTHVSSYVSPRLHKPGPRCVPHPSSSLGTWTDRASTELG